MTAIASSSLPVTSLLSTPLSPSLKRSHDESDMDNSQDQDANKRPRVTFDENIDVRIFDRDDDSKPLEYIRDEVKRGIDTHLSDVVKTSDEEDLKNVDAIYFQITDLFKTTPNQDDAPSTTKLRKYLQALVFHVGSLNRECSALVHAVTDMQWLGRDEMFVGLFRQFLTLLVSAHGGCTASVLKMLVRSFRGLPLSAGQLRNNPEVSKAQMNSRLHATLRYLISVLPSASSTLSNIISRLYPASEDSKRVHINYTKNLLKMVEYVPDLKSDVLSTIVDRLVKVDVEVQVEMDRIDEDIEESGILDEDSDGEDSDEDDDDDDTNLDIGLTEDEERHKSLRESIAKIDAIMDILFTYYHSQISLQPHTPSSTSTISPPTPQAEDAMDALLTHFATAILPKHRSRHTQFLLFHFAQRHPSFIDWFEGAAAHLTRDRTRSQLARTNAADYLASFVARGRRVDADHVATVFDILLGQCDELRDSHVRAAGSPLQPLRPDKSRYGLYYAYVQALLYIFCFRWRDLVGNADEVRWRANGDDDAEDEDGGEEGRPKQDLSELLDLCADDLRWVRRVQPRMAEHVYGPLNPLKICNAGIVKQFAHVGRATRFLYVYPLLENNKKIRLQQGSGALGMSGLAGADGGGRLGAVVGSQPTTGSGADGGDEAKFQLEAYFPFDPYLLPKSKRWLEGDYMEWPDVELWEDKVLAAQEDEDDEEEEGEAGGEGGEQAAGEGAEQAGGEEKEPGVERQDGGNMEEGENGDGAGQGTGNVEERTGNI